MKINLNSNLFEDVKLVFNTGEILFAHRLVLGAASPVLSALLQSKALVATSEVVDLLLPEFDFNITMIKADIDLRCAGSWCSKTGRS